MLLYMRVCVYTIDIYMNFKHLGNILCSEHLVYHSVHRLWYILEQATYS